MLRKTQLAEICGGLACVSSIPRAMPVGIRELLTARAVPLRTNGRGQTKSDLPILGLGVGRNKASLPVF